MGRRRWTSRRVRVLLLLGILTVAVLPQLSPIPIVDAPCAAKRIVGVEIGTCGLTRGVVATAQLRLTDALRLNPVSLLFTALFVKSAAVGLASEVRREDLEERCPRAFQDATLVQGAGLGILGLTLVRGLGYLEAGPPLG